MDIEAHADAGVSSRLDSFNQFVVGVFKIQGKGRIENSSLDMHTNINFENVAFL